MAPIVDGMVSDLAALIDSGLDMVSEELAGVDDMAISMQKYTDFNNMVRQSSFNGKPLSQTLPQSKT